MESTIIEGSIIEGILWTTIKCPDISRFSGYSADFQRRICEQDHQMERMLYKLGVMSKRMRLYTRKIKRMKVVPVKIEVRMRMKAVGVVQQAIQVQFARHICYNRYVLVVKAAKVARAAKAKVVEHKETQCAQGAQEAQEAAKEAAQVLFKYDECEVLSNTLGALPVSRQKSPTSTPVDDKGLVVATTLPVQVTAGFEFVRFKKNVNMKVKPSVGSKVKVKFKFK